jgi:hypothetical protein
MWHGRYASALEICLSMLDADVSSPANQILGVLAAHAK